MIYRICKDCKTPIPDVVGRTKCEACRDRDQNYREREIQERMETHGPDQES